MLRASVVNVVASVVVKAAVAVAMANVASAARAVTHPPTPCRTQTSKRTLAMTQATAWWLAQQWPLPPQLQRQRCRLPKPAMSHATTPRARVMEQEQVQEPKAGKSVQAASVSAARVTAMAVTAANAVSVASAVTVRLRMAMHSRRKPPRQRSRIKTAILKKISH